MEPKIKAIYKTFLNGWRVKDGRWIKRTEGLYGPIVKQADHFGFYLADNFLQHYIIDKKSMGIDLNWKDKV